MSRETLTKWRKENDLSLFQICNLAYIPASTLGDILIEKGNFVAPRARLYHLTGLNDFKLSDEENLNYERQTNDQRLETYWDRKISDKFISDWQTNGTLPKPEYSLFQGKEKHQSKKQLTDLLKKELFGQPKENTIQANTEFDQSKKYLNLDVLEKAIELDDKEFLDFVKRNKSEIKELVSILNVMLDSDPINARNTVKQTKQIFRNYGGRK